MEGFTDFTENAAFARGANRPSPSCGGLLPTSNERWSYPNQYLNVVRELAAPYPRFLTFEAEAVDRFADAPSPQSSTLCRRSDAQQIEYTDAGESQWAVRLDAGQWAEFRQVQLDTISSGSLRIRYRSTTGATGTLLLRGLLASPDVYLDVPIAFTLPPTDTYASVVVTGLATYLPARYDVRLTLGTGNAWIDAWTIDGEPPQ